MGLDVNLYTDGPFTDEEFARGKALWAEHALRDQDGLARNFDDDRVEVLTFARYWGPGYERGPWVDIHSWIIALRACFPGHAIHYGGDSADDAPEVDVDMLATYWAHWESPHWDDYHRRR